MSQDSEEALPSNVVLIQSSFLLCLLQGMLSEVLLPLLYPQPDLLKELKR
jgi:hypothetical protein